MKPFEYLADKEPGRRRGCIGAIKLFLDHIYGTSRKNHGYTTQEEKDLYEKMAIKYIADNTRDHVKDLIEWKKKTPFAAKTLRVYLGCVKEFLEINGIELTKQQEKKIRAAYKGGDEAPTDAPDHGQIRSYLEHGDVRTRAMALLLSSTGMRVGELLSIREESIDFDRRMITLLAKDTKTKQGRVVFFTKEAEKALNQWIKAKEKYIAEKNLIVKAFGKNDPKYDHVAVNDGRVFPYDPVSVNRAWNRNLKRSGQYEKNDRDRQKFHPHSLRQFFSTQLRKNSCPDSIVEVLLGHKPYLSTYIRYSPVELQEAYEKYSPALVIGSQDDVRRTVNALAEKAMEHNGTIENLKNENASIRQENQELKERLSQVEKKDIGAIVAANPDVIKEYIRQVMNEQKQ